MRPPAEHMALAGQAKRPQKLPRQYREVARLGLNMGARNTARAAKMAWSFSDGTSGTPGARNRSALMQQPSLSPTPLCRLP